MKKILVCVIWLLFITGMNLSNSVEYNINLVEYDSGFSLMENAKFDEELVNYIDEHNILIYYQEAWPSPFFMYNKEPSSKTTEINGGSVDVYDKLLSDQNAGTYFLSFEQSNVTMNEFKEFLTSNYKLDIYYFDGVSAYEVVSSFSIIALLSLLVVLLIIIFDYVKKNKNVIYVAKVNGKSNRLTLLLLIRDIILPLTISIILMCVSYVVFMPFYSYFNLFVALLLIIFIPIFILVILLLAFFIQNKQSNNSSIGFPQLFLYLINLAFIILFLIVGINSLIYFSYNLKPLINLKTNEDYYSQLYYANGEVYSEYIETSNKEFWAKSEAYQVKLYEMGAFDFEYDKDKNKIYASENYLEYIGYKELSSYDFIVPLERKEEFLATDCFCDKNNAYYYTKDINLQSPDYHYNEIKNPMAEINHEQKVTGNKFYMLANISLDEYKKIINDLYIDSIDGQGIILFDYSDIYNQQLDRFLETIDDFIMYFILYFIVIIILTMLIIRRFFEMNQQEIMVKRVNGQNFNKKLVQNLVIMNLIAIIICNFKVVEPLSYIFIVVINIIAIILYNRVEKSFRRIHD